jgi:DNA polymerase elongation subunit (family B)
MEDISKTIKTLDLKQNAIKLLINSVYGSFGNKFFYFYNTNIAQSITLQGQDLIGFSIKAVNHYFVNMWHLDTELHEKLGISQYEIQKVNDEAAI